MKLDDFNLPDGWTVQPIDENCMRCSYADDYGSVELLAFWLFDGVLVERIELATPKLQVAPAQPGRFTSVNYCTVGRCECDLGENGSVVVGEGALCVSSAQAERFAYPLGRYSGFEMWIESESASNAADGVLQLFGIDAPSIERTWCQHVLAATVHPEGQLFHWCTTIDNLLKSEMPDIGDLRLATLSLLKNLQAMRPQRAGAGTGYVQKSQRDMARLLRDAIVRDPANPPNAAEIAASLGVSASSLRSYFERVYGISPTTFARKVVMDEAQRQLASTDRPVSDIALEAGYSNPSKFSAAFKREVGMNPLEYRRRTNLQSTLTTADSTTERKGV